MSKAPYDTCKLARAEIPAYKMDIKIMKVIKAMKIPM